MNNAALITGGSKRIGRQIALHLARCGYDIYLHYNMAHKEAIDVRIEIEKLDVKCTLLRANFLDERSVRNVMNYCDINLLINNASVIENDNLSNVTYESIRRHMMINLAAPILLSSMFYKNNGGNIINILDYCIQKMPQNFLSYALSKNALYEYTKIAAVSMAPLVRVNGIALGNVLKGEHQSQENFDKTTSGSPLNTETSVYEICKTIDFIINTKSITGEIIFLDGGMKLNNSKI